MGDCNSTMSSSSSTQPVVATMDDESSRAQLLSELHSFVDKIKSGQCAGVNKAHEMSLVTPDAKKNADAEILRQTATFETDIQKVVDGEMTYSDMRSMYG